MPFSFSIQATPSIAWYDGYDPNLGLNDDVVAAMIAGNPDPKFERFVYDSYRRFIQMFSDVVMEVGKKYFEQLIDKMKADRGVKFDVDLTAADLKELAEQFKAEYKNQLGTEFPSDPVEQLKLAIEAVFRSWDNPRANVYRRDNDMNRIRISQTLDLGYQRS